MKQMEKWATEFVKNSGGPSDLCPNCNAFKYASWLAGFEYATTLFLTEVSIQFRKAADEEKKCEDEKIN